jgi:hypothetical protein
VLGTDSLSGTEALVGVRRRHPDIDDRDIGLVLADRGQERGSLPCLGDDLDPGLAEQAGEPFTEQDGVVC